MKINYVKTDDHQMIYKLEFNKDAVEINSQGREGYMPITMTLLCGKEYVSDEYDFRAWCAPDYFVPDEQYQNIVWYFESESLAEVLSDEGYEPIDDRDVPTKIWQWGEEPTEEDMMW